MDSLLIWCNTFIKLEIKTPKTTHVCDFESLSDQSERDSLTSSEGQRPTSGRRGQLVAN